MGRIGEAAVSEGVAEQQITELVVDAGNGHGKSGKKSKAESDDGEEEDEDGESLTQCEAGEKRFDEVENI
jgi:hypothetical protein